jgi:hypothetical protein
VTHGRYLACGRQAKTHHRKQRTGHSQLAVTLESYSHENKGVNSLVAIFTSGVCAARLADHRTRITGQIVRQEGHRLGTEGTELGTSFLMHRTRASGASGGVMLGIAAHAASASATVHRHRHEAQQQRPESPGLPWFRGGAGPTGWPAAAHPR